MKTILGIGLAGIFLAIALAALAVKQIKARRPLSGAEGKAAVANVRPAAGFAVVELFTSEGCSSCPPADELVVRVQKEDKGQPVYVLAYHVDYWDRLGWKDSFSKAVYSDRQRQYANWLSLRSVYTPQIVVNGSKEFVGSEAATLRNAIEKCLQEQRGAVRLSLSNWKVNGGQLEWKWQAEGVKNDLSLVVALVQQSAATAVRAGENKGRTLPHVQIVRNLQIAALNGKSAGAGRMDWVAGMKAGEADVIAFLQDPGNGKIIAATRSIPE